MTVEAPPEAALFRKIAEVMAEVGYVEKKGYNSFHKYKYVTEADLVDAVRDKLASRQVALIPSVTAVEGQPYTTDKGKHSVVTTVRMSFTFVDGETGAMFRTEWAGQGDDGADKGAYKAMTGAVKYFLMKTFLIPTGDDPEADTSADERSAGRVNGAQKPSPFIDKARHSELVKGFEISGVKPADLKMKLAALGAEAAQGQQGVKAALAHVTPEQAAALTAWFSDEVDSNQQALAT